MRNRPEVAQLPDSLARSVSDARPTAHRPSAILLGPQRHAITVTEELAALGLQGRIAAITAGWQEREAEDDELQDAIGHRAVNLRLHQRCDRAFANDPELFSAHRARQDRLRQLQDLYRRRLSALVEIVLDLLDRPEPKDLLEPEVQHALEQVRALDRHHLARIDSVHAEFEAAVRPGERPALLREREEVAELIDQCEIVAVAGGHVATLLNRMRLLDVVQQFGDRPVLAWSAGAMVLTERVVLFHHKPPQGVGHAEVLDAGLGLVPGLVALPHASRRLLLDDVHRMRQFAQRFSPAVCVCLDPRSRVGWDGNEWSAGPGTQQVGLDGHLHGMAAAVAGGEVPA